jgi:maltose O-acetyltransferase
MASALRRALLRATRLPAAPRTVRWALLRAAGVRSGTRAIAAHTTFTGPDVRIGRGCYINRDCLFDASAPITIGDNVEIGMGSLFATSTHRLGPATHRAGALEALPIVVEDGAWIGARVTVLPGVTIGAGCVIAAGAVVAADCEPCSLYGGVPARLIKQIG